MQHDMIVRIAWRNIWRSRSRSLIIMAAVTLGLWSGIFLLAFYNGMIEQRVNSAIRKEISHIQIHHPEFRKDYDIRYVLSDGNNLMQELPRIKQVEACAARLIIKGMVASANGSTGITINGVMPAEENELTLLKSKLKEGEYLEADQDGQVLISKRLCKKLKLGLKKKLVITFQDSSGNLASAALRVKGIFQTSNSPYDEMNAFVDLHSLATLAGMPGAVNEVGVLLKSVTELPQVEQTLQKKYPSALVENWNRISPEIGLTASVSDQMVFIFMGIILMALAFGIINTMLMAILERTRELGMLMALGMNRRKVFIMILLETLFLILAACPSGLSLGFLTVYWSNIKGIDLGRFTKLYEMYGYDPVVYPSLTYGQFWQIIMLVLFTALFSSLFPARRALKLKPAESIKKNT